MLVSSALVFWTHLVFRNAVDAHGGNGSEHYTDGDQTEHLAGDGVSRILQCQPQTLPDVSVTHFLEVLHVPAGNEEEDLKIWPGGVPRK